MSAPQLDRRTVLRAAAATGGAVVLSGAAGAPWASAAPVTSKRVYVLVIDGCRPDEITPESTPNLHALRAAGRWFPQARSMPIAETIPNHVMMMTGVRPDRSGVPANSIYDRARQEVRTCGEPTDIVFPTMLERLRERGLTTGSVLSKDYLYSVFGTRATYRWEPFPLLPVTNHALDVFTMSALRTMISEADPHLVFANFGDIDRFGHSDLTGSNLQVLRRTALTSTDAQIGSFVSWLRTRSTWSSTTVVVLADHSMDWSDPDRLISLTRAFQGNALLEGQVAIADNGGADVISFLGRSADRSRALAEATRVALATPGVLSVRTTAQLRLGAKAGDLVVYCKSGYRFSDPDLYSNPIPGNHGHPATEAIPFFLTGGAVRPAVLSERAATIDVAPTIAKIFGLSAPRDGFDGVARV
jgi:arylsulfatase A-like enzyme